MSDDTPTETAAPESKPLPSPMQVLLDRLIAVETRWRSDPDAETRAEHYSADIAACMAGMDMQSQTVQRVSALNDALHARIRELNSYIELQKTLARNETLDAVRTAKLAQRPARRVDATIGSPRRAVRS